jgi:hypothetical protein
MQHWLHEVFTNSYTYVWRGRVDISRYTCHKKGHSPRTIIILSEERFGKNHAWLLVSMDNLAKIHIYQERFDIAEQMLQAAVNRQVERSGRNYLGILTMRSIVAETLNDQKKRMEAQQIHQDILASRLAVLGAKHRDTLRSMVNLSNTSSGQGKHQEAFWGYKKSLRNLSR